MTPTLFIFNASSISLIKFKMAFTVDDFDWKPNCYFTNMLLLFKRWYYLAYTTLSITFKNEVTRDMGL
jgi:hypothetical protein